MATATLSISHSSIHRESGVSRNETLSWSMSSIPAGSTINSIKIRMYVGITARSSGYARVQNSSNNGTEYLREYSSGTYTSSSIGSSWISSVTLTFRADSTVYVDFSDFYAIVDYTLGYQKTTVNSVTVTAGDTATFTLTNPKLSELNHKIRLTFGSQSTTITAAVGVGTKTYTIPVAWTSQFPNSSSGTGTIACDTYSGTTLIGTTTSTLRVNAPSSAAPSVTLSFVRTGSTVASGWNIYLQSFSGVDLVATVQTQYSATVSSIVFSDGTVDTQNNNISHVSTINSSGAVPFTVTVTDSRGMQATDTQSITVVPYSAPAFSTVDLQRCNSSGATTDSSGNPLETGTYVLALANTVYSSCDSNNQLSITLEVESNNSWVSVNTLTNNTPKVCSAPGTSAFTNGFDPQNIYKFRVTATDSLGKFAQRVVYLQSIKMIMHVRDNDDGMAFGMVSRKAGFEVNPAWPTYFHGTELIDLIHPVGSIYISVNNTSPSLLFPGTTWAQITDTFLLASGTTYAAGMTGGEATHTLTENELPEMHKTMVLRRFYSPNGANDYAVHIATGSNGTTNEIIDANVSGPVVTSGTYNPGKTQKVSINIGGGQAHNNMPPYLAVYVWKRLS